MGSCVHRDSLTRLVQWSMDKAAGDDLTPVKITLQPLPSKVPASVRLRRLLKIALRSLDLRCTWIEDGQQQGPPSQDTDDP